MHVIMSHTRSLAIWTLAAVLLISAAPVSATTCAENLVECYYRAARLESGWARFLAGLDCELAFADCVLEASAW